MSGEGEYTCTLDEASLKIAAEQLNEDPATRAEYIEQLRSWLKSQRHIKSRTDDAFLLRILRIDKFDLDLAKKRLKGFWTSRSVKGKGAPEWFTNMDPTDPNVAKVIDSGLYIPLGRDSQNRTVVLIRPGAYDPKDLPMENYLKVNFMTLDTLVMDEMVQVYGVKYFLDYTGFSSAHFFQWTRDVIVKCMKCWQEVYPIRMKGLHFYKTPMMFNVLYDLFHFFLNDKFKERIYFHKSDIESLYKEIDPDILPEEYGGNAGPMEALKEKWKQKLLENREEFLYNSQFGIDNSKRSKDEDKDDDKGSWSMMDKFKHLMVGK